MPTSIDRGPVSLTVENLGGIESEQLTFEPGVVALTGRNATNRTSLLRAIVAALGGSGASLKVDAEEGSVELDLDGSRYDRRYHRTNGTVSVDGAPYSDDDVLVDTFASLLKSNPVRRAVEQADDGSLRDVLMAPVDTADIQSQIERVRRQHRQTVDRIEEIERARAQLPAFEERRAELEEALASVKDELESTRATVEAYEADADQAEAAEAVIEALREARTERESLQDEHETQRRAIEALEAERDQVREQLESLDLPEVPLEDIEAELDDLQSRERRLASAINSLLSIIEFNEGLLRGEEALPVDPADESPPVASLDPQTETVDCWTCGNTVGRDEVRDQLDELRELAAERRAARSDLAARIDTLREQRREYEAGVEQTETFRGRLEAIDDEIDDRTDRLEAVEDRRRDCESRIEELEAEAAETAGLRDSDLLEHYQRLSELEYERGRLDRDLAAVDEELDDLAALEEERSTLEAERDDLRDELESLRSRIETVERSVVETFNEHAETVIELLGYENIERVWIERKTEGSGQDGPQSGRFELHVVRAAADGTVVDDTVEHLSESERELVGLTVALAGYLAHDVHEAVPMMVLDSLEAIDAERIAALVDYFADYVPYLVVALLPEDAATLDDEHDRVRMATP